MPEIPSQVDLKNRQAWGSVFTSARKSGVISRCFLMNSQDARDESGMSKTTTGILIWNFNESHLKIQVCLPCYHLTGISASGHRTPSVPHTVAISSFASVKIETVKQFPDNLYILQWQCSGSVSKFKKMGLNSLMNARFLACSPAACRQGNLSFSRIMHFPFP